MESKIEATDMWCYRRMMKISWTERVSIEQILHRVKAKRDLEKHKTEANEIFWTSNARATDRK